MAVDAKTLELRELMLKKYRYIDRKWDLVFWVTAAVVVAAAKVAKVTAANMTRFISVSPPMPRRGFDALDVWYFRLFGEVATSGLSRIKVRPSAAE